MRTPEAMRTRAVSPTSTSTSPGFLSSTKAALSTSKTGLSAVPAFNCERLGLITTPSISHGTDFSSTPSFSITANFSNTSIFSTTPSFSTAPGFSTTLAFSTAPTLTATTASPTISSSLFSNKPASPSPSSTHHHHHHPRTTSPAPPSNCSTSTTVASLHPAPTTPHHDHLHHHHRSAAMAWVDPTASSRTLMEGSLSSLGGFYHSRHTDRLSHHNHHNHHHHHHTDQLNQNQQQHHHHSLHLNHSYPSRPNHLGHHNHTSPPQDHGSHTNHHNHANHHHHNQDSHHNHTIADSHTKRQHSMSSSDVKADVGGTGGGNGGVEGGGGGDGRGEGGGGGGETNCGILDLPHRLLHRLQQQKEEEGDLFSHLHHHRHLSPHHSPDMNSSSVIINNNNNNNKNNNNNNNNNNMIKGSCDTILGANQQNEHQLDPHQQQQQQQQQSQSQQQRYSNGWVSQLADCKDGSITDVLHHLPLLRPANSEAKLQYLNIIPKVLTQAVQSAGTCPDALDQARQLLSYTLIHPGISADERRTLAQWLKILEDRFADQHSLHLNHHHHHHHLNHHHHHLNASASSTATQQQSQQSQQQEGGYGNSYVGCIGSGGGGGIRGVGGGGGRTRSSSLTPPCGQSLDSSQEEAKARSGSISSEAPLSPQSLASSRSSGSDSHLEDQPPPKPGMRDVGVWLKSLRLHKYSQLLSQLSYEELLALDEKTLEAQGVTKGARHKIVLSIRKLSERPNQLAQIEKDMMESGNVSSALNELKSLIITPFPPYNGSAMNNSASSPCSSSISNSSMASSSVPLGTSNTTTSPTSASSSTSTSSSSSSSSSSTTSTLCRGDADSGEDEGKNSLDTDVPQQIPEGDLPSQFTRVMGKVCTQLLVCARPEDESVGAFLGLVDKCVAHEAFTHAHARRLLSWKQQVLRVWHPLPPRNKEARHNRRWSQHCSSDNGGLLGGSFRMPRGTQRAHGSGSTGGGAAPHLPTMLMGGGKGLHSQPPPTLFRLGAVPGGLGGLLGQRNSLPGLPSVGMGLLSPHTFLAKRPSLQETPSERTRSAPSRPHQLPLAHRNPSSTLNPPTSLNPSMGGAAGLPPPVGTASNNSSSSLQPPIGSSSSSSSNNSGGGGGDVHIRSGGSSSHFASAHLVGSSSSSNSSSTTSGVAALGPQDPTDNEITDRLESLCLSVTEHALG